MKTCDRMRMFAWGLVGIGLLIWGLGAVRAIQRIGQYEQMVKMWEGIRSMNQLIIGWGGTPPGPLPAYPATAWEVLGVGLMFGAFPFAFGVLILAIRRPVSGAVGASPWTLIIRACRAIHDVARPRTHEQQPMPRATVSAPPPWEKR